MSDHSPSKGLQELLRVSELYAHEMAIDNELHIARTVESGLFEALRDSEHSWPSAVVGDAGAGKSTVLWSLWSQLVDLPDTVAVLVGSPWLIELVDREGVPGVLDLFNELAHLAERTFVFVDTIDLMLHDDPARQTLGQIVRALQSRGIKGVYASRPQEAMRLSIESLRVTNLEAYDALELPRAVAALASRYCPTEPSDRIVADVLAARARGLPVDDVCVSPLLLRMLFDLASPSAPVLAEMDVTRLYGAYWDRRVRQDARSDFSAERASSGYDLASEVGGISIALLASGLPELSMGSLREVAVREVGMDRKDFDVAIETLLERGVIQSNLGRAAFFHQTMFEFAAAKGVLERGGHGGLRLLTERTLERGGDLFVGAVLEQALILAGADPLLRVHAAQVVKTLAATELDAVKMITSAVWAHHPSLFADGPSPLTQLGSAALDRAAQVIPTVAGRSSGQMISQLIRIWEIPGWLARTAVLRSIARIARVEPNAAADALDYMDPIAAFGADSPPDVAWDAFHDVLSALSQAAPTTVRKMLVASLILPNGRSASELDYLAGAWSHIGDAHLVKEVKRALDAEGSTDNVIAVSLGNVVTAEWTRLGPSAPIPEALDRAVDGAASSQALTTLAAAEVYALVLCLSRQIVGGRSEDMARLIDSPSAAVRHWLAVQVLPQVLHLDEGNALAGFLRMRLLDLPHAVYPAHSVILSTLAAAQLPPGVLRDVLPSDLSPSAWLEDSRLLRLVPMAADDGHRSAGQLLKSMESVGAPLDPAALHTLFATIQSHQPLTESVYERLIALSLSSGLVDDLKKLVISAPRRGPRVKSISSRTLDYSRELLRGDEVEVQRGASLLAALMSQAHLHLEWNEIERVLGEVNSDELLASLLGALWQQTSQDGIDEPLAYLERFVSIDPETVVPVSTRPGVSVKVAVVAAKAALRLLGLRAEPTIELWPRVRELTLHEVDSPSIFVNGENFAVACQFLGELGEDGNVRLLLPLEGFLHSVGRGDFFGFSPVLWERELRRVVALAMLGNPSLAAARLAAACRELQLELAEVITSAIAATAFAEARPALIGLTDEDVDDLLRAYVLELIRAHDRGFGTRAFPQIAAFVRGSD